MANVFPIRLSITHLDKHTPTVWSFFMIPQDADRPSFIPGQVAVLEMGEYGHSYLAFASAPEEDEYEVLIKRGQTGEMNGVAAKVRGALFDARRSTRVLLS